LKKICLIFLSIALAMSMTVSAFALPAASEYADPQPTRKSTDAGFFDIGTATNLTVTAAASSGSVTEKSVDADDDKTFETLYANSDKLNVSYTAATNGAYYVVLLVSGTTLPNNANDIYYINQVTASGTTVNFEVLPIIPDADVPVMTLFITSSSGGTVASVTMGYTAAGTEHWVEGSSVLIGDVDDNGNVEPKDRTILARHLAGWAANATLPNPDAADIDRNGNVEPKDRTILARFLAGWSGYSSYFE